MKRIWIITALIVLLIFACLGVFISRVNKHFDNLQAQTAAAEAEQEIFPVEIETTLTPIVDETYITINPVENEETPEIDWHTIDVSECNTPVWEYAKAENMETASAMIGLWNSKTPCANWYNTGHYFLPDPSIKEQYKTEYPQADGSVRVEYDIPQEEYSYDPGSIIIAATINGKWVMSNMPNDLRLSRYDDTMLHLSNQINSTAGIATWTLYDVRTSELITVNLFEGDYHEVITQPVDLRDIVAQLEPDNNCNWPNSLNYINEFLAQVPNAEIVWIDNRWEELDGCQTGYTSVYSSDNSSQLLVIAQENNIHTSMLEGLNSLVAASDSSGNLFYTNSAEFVTIDANNSYAVETGNSKLLYALAETVGYWDNFEVYQLYQRAKNTTFEEAVEVEGFSYERPITLAGNETANVYSFKFKANDLWHTGIVVFDFDTGNYYGPTAIDNIRQFALWGTQENGEIVGYYNDGSFLTFSLNSDHSVTVK